MRSPDLARIIEACRDISADLRAAALAEPARVDRQALAELADLIEERIAALAEPKLAQVAPVSTDAA